MQDWTLAVEMKILLTLRHSLNAFSEPHLGIALQLVEFVAFLVTFILMRSWRERFMHKSSNALGSFKNRAGIARYMQRKRYLEEVHL